jgi:hypothetical protein
MSPLLRLGLLVATGYSPLTAFAGDVVSGQATDLSVTVYRAPGRSSGALSLDSLNGFALVSETRSVSLPPGESRIHFEGVADGIESASALLTGLPTDVLEKNRDARLLSPSELVSATVGKSVVLVRTDPKNGHASRITGTIRSDAGDGVVFESAEGIEVLRCSGLPETFSFSGRTGLTSTPTLSTLIRSPAAITVSVTISYLAHGFDWAANYVASLSPDGTHMDIGAWVTLANSNGTSFNAARTQVVAGRLNRDSGAVEPLSIGAPILAQCWPYGTTSDLPIVSRYALLQEAAMDAAAPAAPMMSLATARAKLVEEEQLGDLKLYRVPERTTVSSRQMKQVRLLDQAAVPVELLYAADIPVNQTVQEFAARRILRSKNDTAHQLGIPLPSGQVAVFERRGDTELLLSESPLQDTAVGEEFEIGAGSSPDVQVGEVLERTSIPPGSEKDLPLLPGIMHLRAADIDDVDRIEIHNARASPINIELRARMSDATKVIAADHPVTMRYDKPVFALTVAAGGTATIRFRTEHTSLRVVPH